MMATAAAVAAAAATAAVAATAAETPLQTFFLVYDSKARGIALPSDHTSTTPTSTAT